MLKVGINLPSAYRCFADTLSVASALESILGCALIVNIRNDARLDANAYMRAVMQFKNHRDVLALDI